MAYSINPNLPKARGAALTQLIKDKMPVCVVARRNGINRTTLWRWKKKWQENNNGLEFANTNRPSRPVGSVFRWAGVNWDIPTESSAPSSHPKRIANWIVEKVIALRRELNRCAEVVHHHLQIDGIKISLSSVKRILRRYCLPKQRKGQRRRQIFRRPIASHCGSLVEIDTVHYVNPHNRRGNKLARQYVYTVIDLFSRMAYAVCFSKMSMENAMLAVSAAEDLFGFRFEVVQSDNGPEFGASFTEQLTACGIKHRHTRAYRPNDNAHIERFNRTLREECIGYYALEDNTEETNQKLAKYIDFYNNKRLHLGIQCLPIEMLQR